MYVLRGDERNRGGRFEVKKKCAQEWSEKSKLINGGCVKDLDHDVGDGDSFGGGWRAIYHCLGSRHRACMNIRFFFFCGCHAASPLMCWVTVGDITLVRLIVHHVAFFTN